MSDGMLRRLVPDEAVLLVVDVQERLLPAMHPELAERLLENLRRLGEASRLLGLPSVLTEQYPKGLGPTVPGVQTAFQGTAPIAKLSFDACGEPAVQDALGPNRTAIVAGMETHICVFQTVRSLRARGVGVHVLADAVASRSRENYEIGLDLMRATGAVISSTETVLFDLLERAGSEAFRAISKLVR